MKKLLCTLLTTAALVVAVFAQAPTPQPTERLMRIQAEVTTGDVTAFFERSVEFAGVTYAQPWESVSWNASAKTVTVNGAMMTYAEVMQFVVAIAQQERAKQLAPAPAPEPAPNP